MIQDVQEYLQKWEKINNSVYPYEMRWDRIRINDFLKDYKQQLIIPVISNQKEIINPVCPECGSTNLFDFETKMECEDCGFIWNK